MNIENIDETDILINITHKKLRNVNFLCINGVRLYYCEEGLFAANIDCDGAEAFVLVCAKSPYQAAAKIKKMVKYNEHDKN